MIRLGLALALALVAAASSVVDDGNSSRDPVPADDLPRPLVRVAPLGAEPLIEAWTATEDQVALGRRLFFEPALSKDGTVACASCHRPEFAFADDRRFSLGIDQQPTDFNAPSLINKGLSENVFWDGRAATLEQQVLLPIENSREMGLGIEAAIESLRANESYAQAFEAAYAGPPTKSNLADALAAFLRALVVAGSPVDRFRAGEFAALEAEERAGLWVFEGRGGCWRCHNGPNFSDEEFHNTGVGVVGGEPRAGRGAVTGRIADRGKFRTPGLRRLKQTAPYMHDGSLATLEEVVEFYRKGGEPNANLSDEIQPLALSDQDARHLAAFLRALSR